MEKRTAFGIARSSIVDEGVARFVEVELTCDLPAQLDPPPEYIRVRIGIDQQVGSAVEEALLEALRVVRNAIGDETARLTRIVDPKS